MKSLAGSFLVARPSLREPTFAQTVILLLAHNDEGAFGVVINRPVPVKGLSFPVFNGGPCEAPGLLLIHGHTDWLDSPSTLLGEALAEKSEVAPGIYLGDADCLKRATMPAEEAAARVRVCRGYAGWGPGQLEDELGAGAWAVVAATGELLWETPVEELWFRLVPPTLPQPSLN
jgi:putative transcriptional regulator